MTAVKPGPKRHAVSLEYKRRHEKHDRGLTTCSKFVDRDGMPTKEKGAPRKSTMKDSHPRKEESNLPPTPSSIESLACPADLNCLRYDDLDCRMLTLSCFAASSPGPSPLTAQALCILLRHAQSGMTLSEICSDAARHTILDIAIHHAIDCSYLIDQLFAISADHLAVQHPDRALDYQHLATELQTRALTTLNRMTRQRVEVKFVPRLLHSFLLNLHVVFITFAQCRNSFDMFIDHFIRLVHLHRGMRTLAGLNSRLGADSPLGPFIAIIRDAGVSEPSGTECTGLVEFIDSIDPSDAGLTTVVGCRDAARKLQWAFDVQATLTGERALAAIAYPALLTEEYITALRKHRMEALVTLAHYGILLHRCRHVWIFGDAGTFLIRLIAHRLGPLWYGALRWPLEVAASESCLT